jgi:hypothetical protein
MLSSRRNRATLGIDNPINDDGFYLFRHFKAKGNSGKSGKKLWRRTLRKVEERNWRREEM